MSVTLSFEYSDKSGVLRNKTITLTPISGVYVVNGDVVSVNGLTYENIEGLNNFFKQFAEKTLNGQILPNNTVVTINQYVTSFFVTLSVNKLLQFGITTSPGSTTYSYDDIVAHRLSLTNMTIRTENDIITLVTIALNMFLKLEHQSNLGTEMIAFSKIRNGPKIVTFEQDKKLKYKPFVALAKTIIRTSKSKSELGSIIEYDEVYNIVRSIYTTYLFYIQGNFLQANAHQIILGYINMLSQYSDIHNPVVMNIIGSNNLCTLLIKVRSCDCRSLWIGFSFVVVNYLTNELQILS